MNPVRARHHAGFKRRLLAFLLDSVILLLVNTILLYTLFYAGLVQPPGLLAEDRAQPLLDLVDLLLPALFHVGFWITLSATPGKLMLECRVVDARTGQRPTLSQALLRFIGYWLSAIPLFLGFLWILWDRNKQGWHDKLAKTVVVIQPPTPDIELKRIERELP